MSIKLSSRQSFSGRNFNSSNIRIPIITANLVMNLDASNSSSYPGSGTTWTDISGNGKNATLVNGPAYSSANSGYIVFDGTDDYATISSPSPLSGTKLFTFEIWIYFTSITGNFGSGGPKAAFLFAGGTGDGAGQPEFSIQSVNSSSFTPNNIFYGRGGGGTTGSLSISVSSSISNGKWYQIVLVRSASDAETLYLNGSSIGTGNVTNSLTDGTTVFGGLPGVPNYSAYLNGRIANIKIYDKALSATEITQNFNAIRGRYGI
jgi:hypothetical protein